MTDEQDPFFLGHCRFEPKDPKNIQRGECENFILGRCVGCTWLPDNKLVNYLKIKE
jgi:hypothetical protein